MSDKGRQSRVPATSTVAAVLSTAKRRIASARALEEIRRCVGILKTVLPAERELNAIAARHLPLDVTDSISGLEAVLERAEVLAEHVEEQSCGVRPTATVGTIAAQLLRELGYSGAAAVRGLAQWNAKVAADAERERVRTQRMAHMRDRVPEAAPQVDVPSKRTAERIGAERVHVLTDELETLHARAARQRSQGDSAAEDSEITPAAVAFAAIGKHLQARAQQALDEQIVQDERVIADLERPATEARRAGGRVEYERVATGTGDVVLTRKAKPGSAK